jgi:exocyst complex component 2
MALDVVKLYISLISEFFILSDMTASPNSKVPPLLPTGSHSMSTAYYLLKMLNDIQDTVNELNLMEISNETSASLKNLLESVKWRFEDVLVASWLRGKPFFFSTAKTT